MARWAKMTADLHSAPRAMPQPGPDHGQGGVSGACYPPETGRNGVEKDIRMRVAKRASFALFAPQRVSHRSAMSNAESCGTRPSAESGFCYAGFARIPGPYEGHVWRASTGAAWRGSEAMGSRICRPERDATVEQGGIGLARLLLRAIPGPTLARVAEYCPEAPPNAVSGAATRVGETWGVAGGP